MKFKTKWIPDIASFSLSVICLITCRYLIESDASIWWCVPVVISGGIIATVLQLALEQKYNPSSELIKFHHVWYPNEIYTGLIIKNECTVYNESMTHFYKIYDKSIAFRYIKNGVWVIIK